MTFPDLITEANDRGWLLNYLRQHTPDKWEAHLRNPTLTPDERAQGYIFTVSFGSGPTPEAALAAALDMGQTRLEKLKPYTPSGIDLDRPAISSLFRPSTPVEPFKRRQL